MRGPLHNRWVAPRRTETLARLFARLVPQGLSLLDLGCGDGRIAARLQALRPDLRLIAMDTSVRANAAVEVRPFDGKRIPLDNHAVDATLLCDVLHHLPAPSQLLAEARRVSRVAVVIKDHLAEQRIDRALLRFMDFVGNPRSVQTPQHYLSESEWHALWQSHALAPRGPIERALRLYPAPWNRLFGRGMHFAVLLERSEQLEPR